MQIVSIFETFREKLPMILPRYQNLEKKLNIRKINSSLKELQNNPQNELKVVEKSLVDVHNYTKHLLNELEVM